MVLKPDGAVVGPFSLTESIGLGFAGMYIYDFLSDTEMDREGEYLAQMISPSENVRGPLRFTLERRQFFPYGDRIIMIRPDPLQVALNSSENGFTLTQTDTDFDASHTDVDLSLVNGGDLNLTGPSQCLTIEMDEYED